MRKKNIMLGVIGLALAVVTGGQAFAALGPGEISMGVFPIPLPGCAPEVTISEKDTSSGCYTMTIQNKTLQNGVCSSFGIEPIPKKVCDGKDGAGGGDGIIDDVQGVYVPYPQSKGTCSGGTCQYPDRQGYLTTTVSFTDDARQPVVTISLDPCEVFYDETDDNKPKKKCTAQGNATAWLNSDGTGNYEANESYIFEISDPATTLDSGVDPNPYYEYVEPTKNDASGWFENPGHTVKVTVFVNGQQKREFHAVDRCDKYKNSSDPSAEAVVKCMVGEPGKTPGYIAGETKYCLNINPTLCGNYDSLVDDGVCAGAGDDASRTVRSTTTEYYGPSGNSNSTSRNVGYVATTQVMCSNDSDDDITATHNDPCTPASNPTVTCASGYTWQTCTNQTKTSQTYTGCFPSNLGQLFAYKDEIVPPNFASDGTNLYYCQVEDCDNTAACWIDGNKANGPNPNGKLNGTNCWGVVSIDGLQGDAGPGCSFAYYNNQWQVCCLPVDASGNVNVNGSWSCKEVTDTGILNQLNNWMCKPTYTTKYINKKGDGTYEYKSTTDNERTAATVGIRTTITNCDGTNGGDVDVFDGPAGDDYDPCDGLSDTEALNTVSRRTTVYVHHGSTDSSTTTTGIGYYTETNVMCDTSGNKIVKKYDKCDPVSLASGVSRTVGTKICSGNQTLLMCTPQEGDLTPYPFCSDAEVTGYPKKKYFAPTGSDGKITKEGYTALVHKYTSSGNEVSETNGITLDKCDPAIKKSRNANDTATVVKTVSKCTVQDPGTTGYEVGSTYCLNLDSGENCDDYLIIGEEEETYSTQYISPTGTSGKLTVAGYTCRKKTFTRKTTSGSTVSTVEEECQKIQDDTCHKAVKHTRTSSDNIITMAEKSLLKCEVQAPGNTSYTTGTYYCLNLGNGENCNDYVITGNESEQSHDEYVAPTMSNGVPTTVGYLRTSVTNSRLAAGSQTYYTNERKDPGRKVYKGSNSTVKYTVQAPGAESGTFVTGTEYCIGISIEACAEYRDDNPCAGVDTAKESTTVQKVIDRTYTRTENSQGSMVSTYKMCDDSTHTESTADKCKEVPTPDGQTCTNGVWMQCTRQADEGVSEVTARGTTYEYCAIYPQCVGNSNSSTIVQKKQRSYTVPTKTNSENSYYTTPGKVTDVKIACNGSTISTDESAEDQCEEIPDTNSICPTSKKVLKVCKRKGDENSSDKKAESTYNLCTTGTSIFSTISDNDPCGGDTTSDAAKKKVKSIQYEYVAPVTGDQSKRVGYSVKTTTMCHITDGTNDTLTEYIYDTCEPLAASNSCKSGSTYKPYYKCNKQTYDASGANATNREYNACDPLPAAVALSSVVANKLDSDVTFEVKPNSQDSNKNYITITGTNITDKPMVSLESLQGQSVFDIWKEEQTDDNKCRALFDKDCANLNASDMLLDLSAQGNWARSEYGKNSSLTHEDLEADDFQESLKPCQNITITSNGTDDNGGNKYTMTCTE